MQSNYTAASAQLHSICYKEKKKNYRHKNIGGKKDCYFQAHLADSLSELVGCGGTEERPNILCSAL